MVIQRRVCGIVLLATLQILAQNIVQNGDFSNGETGWTLGDYNNVAEGKVVNGEYRLTISKPQGEAWNVQLMQNGISLTQAKTYELTFDAYADADKTIVVSVGPGISGDNSVALSTAKTNYKVSFPVSAGSTTSARLDFNAGKTSGLIVLDNVYIKEFKPNPDTLNLPQKNCRFPTRSRYPFGIKPKNFSQDQMDSLCNAWFEKWKAKYVTSQGCKPGEYRVQRLETGDSNRFDSVSEGIAYGMIIMVYMYNDSTDTKTHFDGLWKYYTRYKNTNNLMTWRIYSDGTVHHPGGSATDADEDAAFALFMAHRQWGSSGVTDYFKEATDLAAAIMQHEVNASNDIRPGDSWDIGNPSYFAPAYYTIFKKLTGRNRWNEVATRTYKTIVDYYYKSSETFDSTLNLATGLQPNWCKYEGGAQGPDGGWAMDHNSFWWDACRFPFRQGYDYLLHGTKNSALAKTNTVRISNYFKTKYASDPKKVKSHYKLNGAETVWTGTPNPLLGAEDTMNLSGFVGAVAVAAMADSDQVWLDTLYRRLVDLPMCETNVDWGTDYFCDILKMLYLLVISGNMPDFYTDFKVDSVGVIHHAPVMKHDSPMLFLHQNRQSGRLTISFSLPYAMTGTLHLCDAFGRVVISWGKQRAFNSGKQSFAIESNRLSNGVYFVKLALGDRNYVKRVICLK